MVRFSLVSADPDLPRFEYNHEGEATVGDVRLQIASIFNVSVGSINILAGGVALENDMVFVPSGTGNYVIEGSALAQVKNLYRGSRSGSLMPIQLARDFTVLGLPGARRPILARRPSPARGIRASAPGVRLRPTPPMPSLLPAPLPRTPSPPPLLPAPLPTRMPGERVPSPARYSRPPLLASPPATTISVEQAQRAMQSAIFGTPMKQGQLSYLQAMLNSLALNARGMSVEAVVGELLSVAQALPYVE